jgi:hypothetical protein
LVLSDFRRFREVKRRLREQSFKMAGELVSAIEPALSGCRDSGEVLHRMVIALKKPKN